MRIVHALGMLIGCALSFAIYRSVTFELIDSWKPFAQLYATVMGGAVGVMLAGGLTLARRWWHGDATVTSQPRHWLLAFGLAAVLANSGAVGAYYSAWHSGEPIHPNPPFWMPFRQASAPSYPGIIHQVVCWGLAGTAALLFCVASFHRLRWHWWAFFPVFFLCAVSMCAGHIAALVDLWGRAAISWCYRSGHLYAKVIVVCSLIVLIPVLRDLWQDRRGDFLHWTGILSWSVIAAMQLGLYFQCMLRSLPVNQYIGILLRP
jgi:hypothetical protein